MCGRFNLNTTGKEIAAVFDVPNPGKLLARYNIAPSQNVMAIRENPDTQKREVLELHWGLIPSWAKDTKIGFRTINAKSETVHEKPSFRAAFKKRRCLIPANGFYEWSKAGSAKIPFHIHLKDMGLFAMAGLWETWVSAEGEVIDSCTVLTTEANAVVQKVHHRMPVILNSGSFSAWLDSKLLDHNKLQSMLKPFDAQKMETYEVSTVVNNARFDDPVCIEKIATLFG